MVSVKAKKSGATFPGGVHKKLAPLVQWLVDETERRGYMMVPGWCWGYACRPIRGSTRPSNHSYGTAVDINAPKNPMTSSLVTDMPKWMIALWKAHGFKWGGDYGGRKDAMHFEFMGSVEDARKKIAALTEPASKEDDLPYTEKQIREIVWKAMEDYLSSEGGQRALETPAVRAIESRIKPEYRVLPKSAG